MPDIPEDQPPSIAVAIGQFVRKFRAENHVSRDALANGGSALGMTWGPTSIENIEAGRFAPTLPTLFALCSAMSAASWRHEWGDKITLPDLFADVERVTIAEDFVVSKGRLLSFFGDTEALLTIGDLTNESIRMLDAELRRVTPTLAERRAAKKIGIHPDELRDAAWHLWSDTLEGIVSKSVGADASAQARGHETRARVAELRQYLAERRGDG